MNSPTIDPTGSAPAPSAPAKPKTRLSPESTCLLFLASRSPTLERLLNISAMKRTEADTFLMIITGVRADILCRHPLKPDTYSIDAEKLENLLKTGMSSGEEQMLRWLICVWNPHWARNQGITFDLFRALDSLDAYNREVLADWIRNPIYP